MELEQALRTALEMEKKGREIYMQVANTTKNPHVKKTFSYLASEEVNHIVEIEEFIEDHEAEVELRGDKPEETLKFFQDALGDLEEGTALADEDVKAYQVALDLEKKGYNFYKEQAEKAQDDKTEEFFSFLMDQENAHFELFQKDLEYLKNPKEFFADEEQVMFEGG